MKRYQVSRGFKYALIVAATGLALLFVFLMELMRFYFPEKVGEFRHPNLRQNQIVSVTANECITFGPGVNHSPNVFLGTLSPREYYVYRLKLGEQYVLDVGVFDKNIIGTLEAWPEGNGGENQVTIVGRVMETNEIPLLIQVSVKTSETSTIFCSFFPGSFLWLHV